MKLVEQWQQAVISLQEGDVLSARLQRVVLIGILLACLAVRIATMASPALDRTDWKEIDYIEISSNYWQHGYNFFKPTVSWPADPPRITAMELPLIPYLAAFLYPVLGFNVYSVRILPLLGFLLLTIYVFRLIKRESGPVMGLLGAAASAVIPLYHPFGNYLFSDSVMLGTSVMALYYFAEWVDRRRRGDWILAWLGFTLAIALKLYPLYLLVPMLWIVFRRHRWSLKEYWGLLKLTLLALVLPVLWYAYAIYLKTHYIDLFYIFDSRKFETLAMLSQAAWYRTMFLRLLAMLAGKSGVPLFLAGLLVSVLLKPARLFLIYLVTIGGYFMLMAQSNGGASYYQFPVIPPFSFFVGCGAAAIVVAVLIGYSALSKTVMSKQSMAHICLAGGLLLISLMGVRRHADIFRDPLKPIHEDKWKLAQIVKQHADSKTKLLTVGEYALYAHRSHDLSPVLYYYSGFQGWSLERPDWNLGHVHDHMREGAAIFVAEQIDKMPELIPFLELMKAHFKEIYEGDGSLILDLRKGID